MKNSTPSLFSIAVLIAIAYYGNGQQPADMPSLRGGKSYQTWLMSADKVYRLKSVGSGEIYRLTDDSITLVRPTLVMLPTSTYAVQDVDEIWLRCKGNILKGTLTGAAAGLITGVIIGFASGDDPECTDWPCLFEPRLTAGAKALIGGVIGAPIGGSLGLVLGAAKIKIPINRKKDKYLKVKDKLETIRYPHYKMETP